MSRDGRFSQSKEVLNFQGGYRPEDLWDVFRAFNQYLVAKPEHIILNFKECTVAFPNSMLPLIAFTNRLRAAGYRIITFLPQLLEVRQRFLHSNWAHYLSPEMHRLSDDVTEPHLAVKHYRTNEEHYSILRSTLDVVLRTISTPRSAIQSLEWAMSEIMDNVLNHAKSSIGGFVQLAIFPNVRKLAFCVADSGQGILESLREGIPALASDRLAIETAVRSGVTRNKDFGQGNGLSGSLALATETGGWFRILSGRAEVAWITSEPQTFERDASEAFYGTVVDVQLPYGTEVDVGAILSSASKSPNYSPIDYQPTDIIETQHLTEDGQAIVLRMRDETNGFGTRFTGEQMRTKAINLLSAEKNLPLVIDWDGVQVIASSYADEFIGKLFVEMGPIGFMTRVRLIQLAPVVQTLINRAIMQRTQQMSRSY